MDKSTIQQAIPHREPFLLVDRLIEWEDDRLVGEKTFTGQEDFFNGHYPDYPLVPGVLLCEAAMQCGAILLSRKIDGEEGKVPVATRMNNVRFKNMVHPGDTIVMEVTLKETLASAFFLEAKVAVRKRTAVRFDFACTLASRTG
jgi:3-hydroxyacyl-[acyl-carrier-protein] dehydratase